MSLDTQLIPSLVEGLFLFDGNGALVRLNPSAERMLGRSSRPLLGHRPEEVFPANPELARLVTESLQEGRSVGHMEVRLFNFERKELFITVSISPLHEADGTLRGAVLLARDETLIHQIEQSFRRADQLATLGTLTLGIAHEIKNPLGGIKGAAQLLAMEMEEGSPLMEHCQVILREVERVDRLLEQMLDATPRKEAHFVPVNIHELLDEVVELVGHWPQSAGHPLVRRYDPSLPPIAVDRDRMVQVFLNLIKNAVEASPPGGEVTVSTALSVSGLARDKGRSQGTGSALEVTVQDRGTGFSPDAGVYATPFYTTKPKGVGLGLVISEQIIQNHGGSLVLGNSSGGGARVRVLLPLKHPEGGRT